MNKIYDFRKFDSKNTDIEDYLLELTEDGSIEQTFEFQVVNEWDRSGNIRNYVIKSQYSIKIPESISSIEQIDSTILILKRLKNCINRSGTNFKITFGSNALEMYVSPKEDMQKLFNDISNDFGNRGLHDNIPLKINFGKIDEDLSCEVDVQGQTWQSIGEINKNPKLQNSIMDTFTKKYGLKFIQVYDEDRHLYPHGRVKHFIFKSN